MPLSTILANNKRAFVFVIDLHICAVAGCTSFFPKLWLLGTNISWIIINFWHNDSYWIDTDVVNLTFSQDLVFIFCQEILQFISTPRRSLPHPFHILWSFYHLLPLSLFFKYGDLCFLFLWNDIFPSIGNEHYKGRVMWGELRDN